MQQSDVVKLAETHLMSSRTEKDVNEIKELLAEHVQEDHQIQKLLSVDVAQIRGELQSIDQKVGVIATTLITTTDKANRLEQLTTKWFGMALGVLAVGSFIGWMYYHFSG